MSDRILQINEFIRGALAEVFSVSMEIPFEFLITVTRVATSADLREANVYLSILPFDKAEEGMAWIVNNRKTAQRLLGLRTRKLRNTPKMRFVLDKNEERASNINAIIDRL